jgi:hypothetical protein
MFQSGEKFTRQIAVGHQYDADHFVGSIPRRSAGVWVTRKSAPALSDRIIGGVNASGFLFASHAFEIGRIGGIGLLRTQSASNIVH